MGLNTSHGCWNGAYSGFCRWRHALAKAAGYWVMPVKYGDGTIMDCILIDWGHLPAGHLVGEWPETPADPLLVLFAHSDCEGRIKHRDQLPLADAMEPLVEKMEDDHLRMREITRRFVDGLRLAHEKGEDVIFH